MKDDKNTNEHLNPFGNDNPLEKLLAGLPDEFKEHLYSKMKEKFSDKSAERKDKFEANLNDIMAQIYDMVDAPFILLVDFGAHLAVISTRKPKETIKMLEKSVEQTKEGIDEFITEQVRKINPS